MYEAQLCVCACVRACSCVCHYIRHEVLMLSSYMKLWHWNGRRQLSGEERGGEEEQNETEEEEGETREEKELN